MNRFERQPQAAVEAEVEYRDGDFRIRRPGAYVRCAVTGEAIPLEGSAIGTSTCRRPIRAPR